MASKYSRPWLNYRSTALYLKTLKEQSQSGGYTGREPGREPSREPSREPGTAEAIKASKSSKAYRI